MKEFDINGRKKELYSMLDCLEEETKELLHRIEIARIDLDSVTTYEEAMLYEETHDLEEGFKYIELF